MGSIPLPSAAGMTHTATAAPSPWAPRSPGGEGDPPPAASRRPAGTAGHRGVPAPSPLGAALLSPACLRPQHPLCQGGVLAAVAAGGRWDAREHLGCGCCSSAGQGWGAGILPGWVDVSPALPASSRAGVTAGLPSPGLRCQAGSARQAVGSAGIGSRPLCCQQLWRRELCSLGIQPSSGSCCPWALVLPGQLWGVWAGWLGGVWGGRAEEGAASL